MQLGADPMASGASLSRRQLPPLGLSNQTHGKVDALFSRTSECRGSSEKPCTPSDPRISSPTGSSLLSVFHPLLPHTGLVYLKGTLGRQKTARSGNHAWF